MTRRLPGLILLATLVALGTALVLARKTRPAPRPRALPPAVAREVDALRDARRARPALPAGGVGDAAYAKGLDRLRAAAPQDLRALEDRVLDRGEDVLLRVDLLQVVASTGGDFARGLAARAASDPDEPAALRLAAVAVLSTFKDPHAFDVLRSLWHAARPFEGRHALVAAVAECGQPGALPILREALGTSQTPDVRVQAALSLGVFAEDAAVREELVRVVGGDPLLRVRENALRALARSKAPEVDRVLREAPPELRGLAEALRKERAP
jgi:hypothetical protein